MTITDSTLEHRIYPRALQRRTKTRSIGPIQKHTCFRERDGSIF